MDLVHSTLSLLPDEPKKILKCYWILSSGEKLKSETLYIRTWLLLKRFMSNETHWVHPLDTYARVFRDIKHMYHISDMTRIVNLDFKRELAALQRENAGVTQLLDAMARAVGRIRKIFDERNKHILWVTFCAQHVPGGRPLTNLEELRAEAEISHKYFGNLFGAVSMLADLEDNQVLKKCWKDTVRNIWDEHYTVLLPDVMSDHPSYARGLQNCDDARKYISITKKSISHYLELLRTINANWSQRYRKLQEN